MTVRTLWTLGPPIPMMSLGPIIQLSAMSGGEKAPSLASRNEW